MGQADKSGEARESTLLVILSEWIIIGLSSLAIIK